MPKEIQPSLNLNSFNCPQCGVLCPQKQFTIHKNYSEERIWLTASKSDRPDKIKRLSSFILSDIEEMEEYNKELTDWDLSITVCEQCQKYAVWENERIIFPFETELPVPSEDMPEEVRRIYVEASQVFKQSPRAAAALLRLGIETLIPLLDYGVKKAKINTMVGDLVKVGIPEHIQQGLDSIRVYGNEGIHPGEINLNDDQETVMFLFELINIMVEELITRKKKINLFYNKLPLSKLQGIVNRDK